MPRNDQQLGESERALLALARRERYLENHWSAFKMRLRATRYALPDDAVKKYLEEKAQFDRAMQSLEEQRQNLVASDALSIRSGRVGPAVMAREFGECSLKRVQAGPRPA